MKYRVTMRKIINELYDGLEMNQPYETIRAILLKYCKDNKITLIKLRDQCWEDSTVIFDYLNK